MRHTSTAALVVSAFCLAGCSNAQYFHVATAPAGAFTGSNCGNPAIAQTYTGAQNSTEWGIFAAPKSQYLLEGAADFGAFLTGTANQGAAGAASYTFTGTKVDDDKPTGMGAVEVTYTTTDTVKMTVNAYGVTGTFVQGIACHSSDGTKCVPHSNGLGSAGASNGQDFDCSTTEQFVGTSIQNVSSFHAVGSAGSSAQ